MDKVIHNVAPDGAETTITASGDARLVRSITVEFPKPVAYRNCRSVHHALQNNLPAGAVAVDAESDDELLARIAADLPGKSRIIGRQELAAELQQREIAAEEERKRVAAELLAVAAKQNATAEAAGGDPVDDIVPGS